MAELTDAELVALGLCDEDKLHTSRPAFVRALLRQGATVDNIRDAAEQGQSHLHALMIALVLYPPDGVDAATAAAQAKVSVDELREWWRIMGWPDPTTPGTKLNRLDQRLLQILSQRVPMGVLPAEVIQDFLRTAAGSASAVAEAMTDTMRIGLDKPALERGDSALELALAHRDIVTMLTPEFIEALGIMFKRAVVEIAKIPR